MNLFDVYLKGYSENEYLEENYTENTLREEYDWITTTTTEINNNLNYLSNKMNVAVFEGAIESFVDADIMFGDSVNILLEATENLWTRFKKWVSKIVKKLSGKSSKDIDIRSLPNQKIISVDQDEVKQIKRGSSIISRVAKVLGAAAVVGGAIVAGKKISKNIRKQKEINQFYKSELERYKNLNASESGINSRKIKALEKDLEMHRNDLRKTKDDLEFVTNERNTLRTNYGNVLGEVRGFREKDALEKKEKLSAAMTSALNELKKEIEMLKGIGDKNFKDEVNRRAIVTPTTAISLVKEAEKNIAEYEALVAKYTNLTPTEANIEQVSTATAAATEHIKRLSTFKMSILKQLSSVKPNINPNAPIKRDFFKGAVNESFEEDYYNLDYDESLTDRIMSSL